MIATDLIAVLFFVPPFFLPILDSERVLFTSLLHEQDWWVGGSAAC